MANKDGYWIELRCSGCGRESLASCWTGSMDERGNVVVTDQHLKENLTRLCGLWQFVRFVKMPPPVANRWGGRRR